MAFISHVRYLRTGALTNGYLFQPPLDVMLNFMLRVSDELVRVNKPGAEQQYLYQSATYFHRKSLQCCEILSQLVSTLVSCEALHNLHHLPRRKRYSQRGISDGQSDSRFVRSFGSFSSCAKIRFGNNRVYLSLDVRRRSLSLTVMTRRAHLARSPGVFHSPCGAHRPEIWSWRRLSGEQLRELGPPRDCMPVVQ